MNPKRQVGWPSTERQKQWANYVVFEGMNPYAAAVKAGYSPVAARGDAYKMQRQLDPYLKHLQAEKNKLIDQNFGVSIEKVVRRYAAIAMLNLKHYYRRVTLASGQEGLIGIPLHELSDDLACAIEKFETSPVRLEGGEMATNYRYSFHDKMNALHHIGRHLGMFDPEMIAYFRSLAERQDRMDLTGVPPDALVKLVEAIERVRDVRALPGESKRLQ